MFARKVMKSGFDIERAALRAPSAAYFIESLQKIGKDRT
jgi:hypothetical protein